MAEQSPIINQSNVIIPTPTPTPPKNSLISQLPLKLKYLKNESRSVKISSAIEVHPITYQSKHLIIQTPRLYLPFGVSSSTLDEDPGSTTSTTIPSIPQISSKLFGLQLSLEGFNTTPAIIEFIRQINLIDSHFKTEWANYKFTSTIRESRDQFYPPFLRVKIPKNKENNMSNNRTFTVYDLTDSPKSIDYIVPGSWATSLIYLKHIWVNNQTYNVGLTWYVLQTKVKTPVPQLPIDRCLIDDPWLDETFCSICYSKVIKQPVVQGIDDQENNDSNDNNDINQLPEEYEKYTKMLKLGIPILAVVQRCQMDGLDPEVLHNHQQNRHKHKNQSRLPPPPPSMPKKLKNQDTSDMTPTAIPFSIADLLASREKLGTSSSAKIRKIKPLNVRKRDPRVPSLNMILQSRSQLKPTNKPSDFNEPNNSITNPIDPILITEQQ